MQNYEKLGAFYLGRLVDQSGDHARREPLLYDAKDLTTHAVCVGMTGSGKTGLCLSLIEEAAIDGIPVIAIDPKGDLGNLLLTFPELSSAEFAPWIDEGEATRKGMTSAQYADHIAKLWRKGLADWDQDGERIARLRAAADAAIYTPGSRAGLPLTVLRSFAAPAAALADDSDALQERIQASTSGLLALLGIAADPLRSREHILIANILDRAWRTGRDLEIADLIREIQSPPFERLGVFELDAFFPGSERFALAMQLNNLLASPGFGAWMEGEPLDPARLLWTAEGRPRISILSIAHLSDAQRMFFVTILLNELLAWMRTQPGTTSLRAILYMDEVFGYLPPTANPPSKLPLLTLLKQARAFGLGCVLATQNPVDLDYKALSNAGTWFLGRLQTERDKARLLDGLEGAAAGASFDRKMMEATISGLQSRVFLMNNVHDDAPALFHTRWAMSYLRGPLTRDQIETLMRDRRAEAAAPAPTPAERHPAPASPPPADHPPQRPPLPDGIRESFLRPRQRVDPDQTLVYRPALLGESRLHYVAARDGVDLWEEAVVFAPIHDENVRDPWSEEEPLEDDVGDLPENPLPGARFMEPPSEVRRTASFTSWGRQLKDHLYRTRPLVLLSCPKLKETSRPHESAGEFRVRLAQSARERRDLEIEKLRKRYAPKLKRLEERIRSAEQRVEVQESQYKQQKMQTAISFGATLLGALFGRKAASVGTVGRASTTARGMGRAARERGDVARAKATLESLEPQLAELEREFEEATERVRRDFDLDSLELEEKPLAPRKSDIRTTAPLLVWTPWRVDASGVAEPLFD
jgi:hypothetical protein